MSVSVVVGGQFGSEGKGKVVYYHAKQIGAAAIVKVGGTNSGHTVYDDAGNSHTLRVLPVSAVDLAMLAIIPSGAYIDLDLLHSEIESTHITADRLLIDPFTVIIDSDMKQGEQDVKLREKIGSTLSGTGHAVIQRMQRLKPMLFAKDVPTLQKYISNTKEVMRNLLNANKHIVIEGTQGFGLSPINSKFHPFCTSRDTTAGAFVAEAGLSPLDVENVIMVIRSLPIRVGGNSGELANEISWKQVVERAKANVDLTELTSATKRIRRVGNFDADLVKQAITVNNPNMIVLNHADYWDYSCNDTHNISGYIRTSVENVETSINRKIDLIGLGKNILVPFH